MEKRMTTLIKSNKIVGIKSVDKDGIVFDNNTQVYIENAESYGIEIDFRDLGVDFWEHTFTELVLTSEDFGFTLNGFPLPCRDKTTGECTHNIMLVIDSARNERRYYEPIQNQKG